MIDQPVWRIREVRKDRGLSGTEVAAHLNISAQYYYDIERGKKNLSADKAMILARVFKVSLDYLLGNSDDPNPLKEVEAKSPPIKESNSVEERYKLRSGLTLSSNELDVVEEMKKYPVFFNDLASDPSKLKKVIKMWEFIKNDIENDTDDEPED
ncbi:helix-turn-helix domain-containing protein [Brevibacillus reuszeri]|uniref:helix-turn-helix domain-containing protein n=1 Tax=Brevibacillus reuszeri TaxID=54915 RepID=UPI00367221DD